MLKVRVIPTLLLNDFGLVKGVGFDSWRRVGSLLPAIKVYNTRDVDELLVMNIQATPTHAPPDPATVSDFSDECAVPLTVGGGITNLEQISQLLYAGADKVLINTAAYTNLALIEKAAMRFGSQCIVIGIDAKKSGTHHYQCFSHAGRFATPEDPVSWAKKVVDSGAGELVITSIARDGTMQGYDLELTAAVAESVDTPVIASGGAGNYEHMCQAILQAGASAVAAASMFHYTEQTPAEAKIALEKAGIPVRKAFAPQRP